MSRTQSSHKRISIARLQAGVAASAQTALADTGQPFNRRQRRQLEAAQRGKIKDGYFLTVGGI